MIFCNLLFVVVEICAGLLGVGLRQAGLIPGGVSSTELVVGAQEASVFFISSPICLFLLYGLVI